jgi:hypothetical protein
MKSKTITAGVLFIGLAISFVAFTNKTTTETYIADKETNAEGKALFMAKCTMCHITTKPTDMSTLIAPPMMGVMMHLKQAIKGKDETSKREKTIEFIVDYVQNPSADKSMIEPQAIKRFKLMPTQKENVSVVELTKIANYVYDNFPPKGMSHEKMHKGSKGCGADCGDNCKH